MIRHEIDVSRHQLNRNRVELVNAEASFVDPHTVRLNFIDAQGYRDVTADNIVIAVGSSATKDPHIPFDGRRIFTSDEILTLDQLPRTLAVVGAGVIGCEYASIFAALGIRVTLIDKRPRLLPFVDAEISDTLAYHLRDNRVTLWLNEEVKSIEPYDNDHGGGVTIHLASGKKIFTEKALYSIGRTGSTDPLHLEAAGLAADDRGRLKVNEHYQTAARTSMRSATSSAFPVWRRFPWSREGWRLAMLSGLRRPASGNCSRTESTPSRRFPWWAAMKKL